jgi:hypothetical protein
MELMMVLAVLVAVAFAGRVAGADSRRSFDDEQHRAI